MRVEPDEEIRVAVVIPCHNDGATLGETLQSLESQEHCEVVVVDDGSDVAETVEFLRQLERRGTRVVHQTNQGPAAARNTGAAATSARYVFPLDADDLLTPGALSALADALDADGDLALAWGDTRMFGGADFLSRKIRFLDPWLLSHLNPLPTTTLIRRRALDEVGGWSEGIGYEDWDLWMSLAERGARGRHVGRLIGLHRVRRSSRFAQDLGQHERIVAELRNRHPRLFAHRARSWRASSAPWRFRLLLPFVARVPLSPRGRLRLIGAVDDPVTSLRRLARGLTGPRR